MFRVLTLISIASAGATPAAQISSPSTRLGAVLGVRVAFKSASPAQKDRIHRALHNRLLYRAKFLNFDEVTPLDRSRLTRPELKRLCESYSRLASIEACELMSPVEPAQAHSSASPISSGPSPSECRLIPEQARSGELAFLTKYWAQEYIGADLISELVTPDQLGEVSVADIDSGYAGGKGLLPQVETAIPSEGLSSGDTPDHAVQVLNLLAGKAPLGVALHAKITHLESFGASSSTPRAIDGALKNPAAITNLEFHTLDEVRRSPKILRSALETLAQKSIVVGAAGNRYPQGSAERSTKGIPMILVGSMRPDGWPSSFTDESEDLTVLAPSNYEILSSGEKGPSIFGGTSGATPLVSGAVANLLGVLKGATFDEVQRIVQQSATPLPSSVIKPQRHGTGMLNAYKMMAVALRLKKRGWPEHRQDIESDKTLFSFDDEAGAMNEQAKRDLASADCLTRQKGVLKLRKAQLLHSSPETSLELGRIYRSAGFSENAKFYETNVAAVSTRYERLVQQNRPAVAGRGVRELRYEIERSAPPPYLSYFEESLAKDKSIRLVRVSCSSSKSCELPGDAIFVKNLRVLSSAPCRENKDYQIINGRLVLSAACRASFEVYVRAPAGDPR